MSSERGNIKKAAPRYQNSFKFHHNKNSKKTAQILSAPIEGVCKRCTDKLAWKKNYRKYKPLTVPRKCTRCEQKTVYRAYHIVCEKCATDLKICAKCVERSEIVSPFVKAKSEQQDEKILASLSERKRRTYLRMIERGHTPKIGPNGEITIEIQEEGGSESDSEENDENDVEGDGSDDLSDDLSEDEAPKPKSAKPVAAPKKSAVPQKKPAEPVAEDSEDGEEGEDEEGEEGSMESFDEDLLSSDDEVIVDQVKQDRQQRKQV